MTHLSTVKEGRLERICNFYLQSVSESKNSPFLYGYCLHLATDYYWNITVFSALNSKFDEAEILDEARKWAYYNDVDQLDFILFRTQNWRPEIWNLLESAPRCDIKGMLTAEEIAAWNNRTLRWYDSGKSQHNKPIRFLTEADLLKFVDDTSKFLKSSFIQL